MFSFLVHIVKGDIVDAVPLDLFPRHTLAIDQFHSIRLIRFEVFFFVLVVHAVPQFQHQLGGGDLIPLEGTILQFGWIMLFAEHIVVAMPPTVEDDELLATLRVTSCHKFGSEITGNNI